MCDRRRRTNGDPKNKKVVRPMPICSFCLGDEKHNRNGKAEVFISCVDCGNSGHPSCLKFSEALTERVKTTKWQCIDCKRCARCEGIGRDENMLFCDSCDRGVHMKCCLPPLKELPSGEWFCFVCESSMSRVRPSRSDSFTGPRESTSTKFIRRGRPPKSSEHNMKASEFPKRQLQGSIPRVKSVISSLSHLPKSSQKRADQANAVVGLNDGLTKFFTPSNKRRSRVSSVSLEGIAVTNEDGCLRRSPKGKVAQRSSHHLAASRLIKKSFHVQRNQFRKESEERTNNLRALAALHDGLSKYFAVRGKRKSLFRRGEKCGRDDKGVLGDENSAPASVKTRRQSSRGDHVELLFDDLTHLFTARGKRPPAFRKRGNASEKTENESLVERRKRQHRHKSQVQALVDGLSKFFTTQNPRRSQDGIKTPERVPDPTSFPDTKDIERKTSNSSESRLKRCKTDGDSLQNLLPKSRTRRVKVSGTNLSSSQRAANQIAKRSRQFKTKKVGRRRGESCQLKSLFDGLSHLYTAQGDRQRKSFNFYSQCIRRRRTSVPGSPVNSTETAVSPTRTKSPSVSNSEVAASVTCSSKLGKVKLGKIRAKSGVLKKRTVGINREKMRKWSHSMGEMKDLVTEISKEDVELFRQAQETSEKRYLNVDEILGSEQGSVKSGLMCIVIGKYEIAAWHASPYPADHASLSMLYICEFCLKYFRSRVVMEGHMMKCTLYHPPGDEIYRSGPLSVYEVDGKVNKQYCQNLCLLAKLFLDHKTLYYDVEPFLFYILTHTDDGGSHLIGYFSKEKYCQQKYNLSCIMTLPPFQRRGYGRFLIDFSYLLSRQEGQPGSPEKPLSDLGWVSYSAYWKSVIIEYLHKQKDLKSVSLQSISEATGLTPDDIACTLQSLEMFERRDSRCVVVVKKSVLDDLLAKENACHDRRIPLSEECLHWYPFVAILGADKDEKTPPDRNSDRHLRSCSTEMINGGGEEGGREGGRDVNARKRCLPGKKRLSNSHSDEKRSEDDSCSESDGTSGVVSFDLSTRLKRPVGSSFPRGYRDAPERRNGNSPDKSLNSVKKSDRGRVSCNDRSPQIENDHPNKPRKRPKNNLKMAAFGVMSTEGQEGSAVCQSQNRDSVASSSETSGSVSSALNCKSSSEIPLVGASFALVQNADNLCKLSRDAGSSPVCGQDAEEVDVDRLARVKNLRTIVDIGRESEVLTDVVIVACGYRQFAANRDERSAGCYDDNGNTSGVDFELGALRKRRIQCLKQKSEPLEDGSETYVYETLGKSSKCNVCANGDVFSEPVSAADVVTTSASDGCSVRSCIDETVHVDSSVMCSDKLNIERTITGFPERRENFVGDFSGQCDESGDRWVEGQLSAEDDTKGELNATNTNSVANDRNVSVSSDNVGKVRYGKFLQSTLASDDTGITVTPGCAEFRSLRGCESEDENECCYGVCGDPSDYGEGRCDAPDYAELFGFHVGDLQDRMDEQVTSGSDSFLETEIPVSLGNDLGDVPKVPVPLANTVSAFFPGSSESGSSSSECSGLRCVESVAFVSTSGCRQRGVCLSSQINSCSVAESVASRRSPVAQIPVLADFPCSSRRTNSPFVSDLCDFVSRPLAYPEVVPLRKSEHPTSSQKHSFFENPMIVCLSSIY